MFPRLPLLVAAVLLPASARCADPADVLAACAWVRAENDGSGGGVVVDGAKRRLVTCRHVVGDRDTVDVFFPWHRDGRLVTDKADYLGNRALLRERGLLVTGRVVKRSDAADLALVELDALPPGVTALPFAAPARPGDPLRAVGHRLDLDTLWNTTTGPARQVGRLADGYHWRGKKLAANADTILAQLPVEEGDSGGPVVNARGELVGIVSALRRQMPTAAVVISAAEIRTFLAAEEPKPRPQPPGIGDALTRATVWVRPTATDLHAAGVLFEKNLILTSAKAVGAADQVGIAFPLRDGDRWVGERGPYRDPVGLHLKGAWRAGTVLSRDDTRDLAVIRVDSVPDYMRPIPLAAALPAPGDAVHAMSHPGGLEFAWVYAAGSVRQRGRVALADGEKPARVVVHVLQLPAQAASPGGPVVNARGELVGVLSSRESAQQTGYAATTDEIAAFLDVALTDRPPRTVAGLVARVEAVCARLAAALAGGFASRATGHRDRGQLDEAKRDCRTAIALNPGCHLARSCLVSTLFRAGEYEAIWAELDAAADTGPFDPRILSARANSLIGRKEWRKARSDLERILEVHPGEAGFRQSLVGVLLELNKDDEAAAAVGDTLRTDPQRFTDLAADLLKQADALAEKFPDTPSRPAGWLTLALTAAHRASDAARKADLGAALKRAAGAKDDVARLAVLRGFVERIGK